MLAKLRDFFESKGIAFADDPPEAIARTQDAAIAGPHPRVQAVKSLRYCFPIAADVSDDVVQKTLDVIDDGDARLEELLEQTAKRSTGFLGDDALAVETERALQEAGAIMAANYLLFRRLTGWSVFDSLRGGGNVETVFTLIVDDFAPQLEEAGFPDMVRSGAADSPAAGEEGSVEEESQA